MQSPKSIQGAWPCALKWEDVRPGHGGCGHQSMKVAENVGETLHGCLISWGATKLTSAPTRIYNGQRDKALRLDRPLNTFTILHVWGPQTAI